MSATDGYGQALRQSSNHHIRGEVMPGFEHVERVFLEQFERGDVGSALSVYQNGHAVVDIAAGTANVLTGAPYIPDTLQLVFSTTKGMTALVAHALVERGLLSLDVPVAQYWPEFAQGEKGDIPVRWLLTHEAGLVALDQPISHEEFLNWDLVCARLAAQRPLWKPGARHGYHSLTYGFLVGEVVRRITGCTIGNWFQEHIAKPLGASFYIGLPEHLESRVAVLITSPEFFSFVSADSDPHALSNRAMNFVTPALGVSDFNKQSFHRAELPAINGIGTAHALARIYAAMIGVVDDVRLLGEETVERIRQQQWRGNDLVNTSFKDDAVGMGFMLPGAHCPLGGPGSFGSAGIGGSRAWALPERNLAFAYVLNRCTAQVPDSRETALSRAVLECAE
jgi:CubicO group peptidase (beta-lactamase class C family)